MMFSYFQALSFYLQELLVTLTLNFSPFIGFPNSDSSKNSPAIDFIIIARGDHSSIISCKIEIVLAQTISQEERRYSITMNH